MIQLRWESGSARIGTVGPLVLTAYQGTPSLTDLEQIDRVQAELLQTFPRLASLSFLDVRGMTKVNDETRARSEALTKKYETTNVGLALVVLSRGLGAVMARTFLSGFLLMSRSEFPMKVFPSGLEGLEWLRAQPHSPLLGVLVTEDELFQFSRW